jgi:DMSO/TMAO reductase YedYZ molybdopterin-dependent catalytic subunit
MSTSVTGESSTSSSTSSIRPSLGSLLARGPRGRSTNLTLLLALLLAFATGVGAVSTGSPRGRWVVIGHGLAAAAVILLIPWKGRVVRRGLRRARLSRWASLLLAGLALATLFLGVGYSTGIVRSVAGVRGMWLHVAAALLMAPLLIWHLTARSTRSAGPRRSDVSRRNLLRLGTLGVASAGIYVASWSVVRLADLPGTRRRFTGSYEAGSFNPPAMPTTIWLDDSVPTVDPEQWRLVVVDGAGRRELTLAALSGVQVRLTATLDCTSGWYAEQEWAGVPVSALLRDLDGAKSLLVHSITGYWVRFPVHDLDRLLLATSVGGAALAAGHGFPLRLVAPGRRGFWWVKWVDRIELSPAPPWWQPPFPVT